VLEEKLSGGGQMKSQSPSTDEQIALEDRMMFSTKELEEFLLRMYTAVEKTFYEISGYAQGSTRMEAQFQKVLGLESQFKKVWEELKVNVSAIIVHTVVSEQKEQEWSKLARGVCEEMAFLQVVASGEEITPEWLARRNALVAQTASLLKKAALEESIRQ
jgi:hypothetical protein